MTRFFGREEEMARLHALLLSPGTRLVTLTGPGGSGKTRLAIEVATRLGGQLRNAVWFVPLGDTTDAASLPDALLDVLQLPHSPGVDPLDQVVAALAQTPALLVLDGFEQLVEQGSRVIARLLHRLDTLRCLVTSRRPLSLAGERQFLVPPLPVPHDEELPEQLIECPSVRLFVDRAQAVRPDFQVRAGNAPVLSALCARLDGIPLAIEVVAARAHVLSPTQMLARLDELLDWEAGRAGDGADQHRTLRAAIDWSYRLLSPELQRFFERLSVFRGTWGLDAAGTVCAADDPVLAGRSDQLLADLQAHSLILAEERGAEMRFRMLETLRDYAWERLVERGETAAVCLRHAEHFLGIAEESGAHQRGWEKQVRLDVLDLEHDNLRAALSWAAESAPAIEARLAAALAFFWETRGHSREGRRHLDAVLARSTPLPPATRASLLHGAARLAWFQGDFPRADAILQEALDLHRAIGEKQGTAAILSALADVAHRRADVARSCALLRESLSLCRELGDTAGAAGALYRLGMSLSDYGDHLGAEPLLKESLEMARAMGDQALTSAVMGMLGHVIFRQGRLPEARATLERALATGREANDKWAACFARWSLGNLALTEGDVATASAVFREGMPVILGMGNRWGVAYGLESFGYLAAAMQQFDRAARLLGAAQALREAIGAPLPPANTGIFEHVAGQLQLALGEDAFPRLWAEGRTLSLEEAASYAMEA